MIGNIVPTIYDGSLPDHWEALITFEQMLILADENGFVDMTPESISRRTGIPLEYIQTGIKYLEQPDPSSRTPTDEGRRIRRIDEHREWSWRIVNHGIYNPKPETPVKLSSVKNTTPPLQIETVKKIVGAYHKTLPELTRVNGARWEGSIRQKNLAQRWKENKQHQQIEFWEWFFKQVRTNPFWLGDNDRGWKADFGWLIKRGNFDKVIERSSS